MDTTRAKTFAKQLLGQSVAGWELTDYVGAGKSALVFKATQSGTTAAVKIFDPELVERFGKDVQLGRIDRELALRGQRHPNLVGILDGGHCPTHDILFVVMEYFDFPNLAEVVADVPRERLWPLIGQVASAANFLESLNLAHRDIKPDNIVVSPDFQKAVLLDLGVIRPIGVAGLTDGDQRSFVGTLQYSSPEFLFRTEKDTPEGWRALTFYQLGAVLHDMIVRQRLFSDFANPFARLVEAVKHEIPKIEAPDVPADLVLLAKNSLSKDPELRLRLVSWPDFEPRVAAASSAADAKERIRKRRAQAQRAEASERDIEAEQQARAARRVVESVQADLQATIRRHCAGSELFPPLEINERQDSSPECAHFAVTFTASDEYGLANPLSVYFAINLLDRQSVAVQIQCAAAAATAAMPCEAFLERPLSSLFEGVFEEAVVRVKVQDLLFQLLDSAQQLDGQPGEGAPVTRWLEIPGASGKE